MAEHEIFYSPDNDLGTFYRTPAQGAAEPALEIQFQHGPVAENGVNGIQNEELISLLIMRLTNLNQPPFNCRQNSLAITKLEEARMWLEHRTAERVQRGVEGTNTP